MRDDNPGASSPEMNRKSPIQSTTWAIGFSLNVCKFLLLNSLNSVTKTCHSVKRLEPLTPSHLLCKRPICYDSTSTTHVRDRNFKLRPIHASMIIIFPKFAKFSESYLYLGKPQCILFFETPTIHEL